MSTSVEVGNAHAAFCERTGACAAPKQEQERDDLVAAPRRGVADDALPPMATPRPPRSCRLGSCQRVGGWRVCCRWLI